MKFGRQAIYRTLIVIGSIVYSGGLLAQTAPSKGCIEAMQTESKRQLEYNTKTLMIITDQESVQKAEKAEVSYQFRKPAYLTEQFSKHGKECGAATEAAYLEATNGIVFVSKDGFIRTYFKPENGRAYYDKQ